MLWTAREWWVVVVTITPHMSVSTLLCLVYSTCITCSDPLLCWCNNPVLHVCPKFSVVVVFHVLTLLHQVVRVFLLLKSNGPSISVYADTVGFHLHVPNTFNVMVVYGMRRHKRCIRNRVSMIARPAIKRYFHALMNWSSALTLWMCGGTNWYHISSFQLYFLRISDASLSRQYIRGL